MDRDDRKRTLCLALKVVYTMPLVPRRHQHWIHDFITTVAPRSEAPSRYLYWAAVATLGGAIRRRCYIDMGTFQWYPNWYILLVGPPGLVKKSTTIDIATRLLRQVPGVVFGSDCTTWQQFVSEVAAADDTFATGGTAGASFMDQEYVQSSAITFAISEFGTFFNPKDLEMVNVLTAFWDGSDSPFRKATKTSGTDIINSPFVNMIAGTTPRWLGQNFAAFAGWGLSARMILLHADEVSQYIPYPDEKWGDEAKTWSASFLEDLTRISNLEGPVHISPEARELARPWYPELMERIKGFSSSQYSDIWTQDYLQRKWSHMWKLALILSVAQSDRLVISPDDVQEAMAQCDAVEDELSRIFRTSRAEDQRQRLAQAVGKEIILGLLVSGGACPASRIYQHTYRKMNNRETDDLLSHMVKSGFVSKEQRGDEVVFVLEPTGRGLLTEHDLKHAGLPPELLVPQASSASQPGEEHTGPGPDDIPPDL